ncbi:hypothetical protein BpHYR1_045582 [Brachionus plicatilis]|uniref:Uncharacterized protein n=1 Tax=Brachionus plicatilis TaxID=10195 RepID=A0A3M7QM99_BRAPC|nr:hypothetical protein BpHYR1_045582 [Brachionus plicatilis]
MSQIEYRITKTICFTGEICFKINKICSNVSQLANLFHLSIQMSLVLAVTMISFVNSISIV